MKEKPKKEYKDPMLMKDHWEMDVSRSIFPRANVNNNLEAWYAKEPSQRPTPHVKINECDH